MPKACRQISNMPHARRWKFWAMPQRTPVYQEGYSPKMLRDMGMKQLDETEDTCVPARDDADSFLVHA